MFDIGWPELLVVAIVLIVVVGPKDLPRMLRAFGKTTSRMRSMAGEFRSQFEDALKEADLDDVRQTISDAQKLNPAKSFRDAMNPLRKAGDDIKAGLSDAVKPDSLSKPDAEDVKDVPDPAVDIATPTPSAQTDAAPENPTATPAALSGTGRSARKNRPATASAGAEGAEKSARAGTTGKKAAGSKKRTTKSKSAKSQPASAEDVREPASAGKAQAARTRSANRKAVGTAGGEDTAKKAPAKKAPARKTGSRSKGGGGTADAARASVKTASASASGSKRAGKADDDR